MQYSPPGENYPQYPPVTYPPGGPYPPPPHGGYPPGPYPGPTYPPPVPQYAIPVAAPGCPPGLEYLLPLDQVIVKQKKELLELMTDIETANTYVCLNVRNEIIYKCTEESNFCARQCLRAQRPFYMHLFDPAGHEVIRVHRPYKCYCCWECCTCSSCCQDEVEIQAPVGVTAGYVKQICSGMSITYDILNADRQVELKICGPCYCYCKCFGEDIDFPIKSRDESVEIGKISKKWTGIVQEWFTDADTFGVSFKLNLDVRMKAVLIGAVFLIDFMFFEENQPKKELDGHL